MAPRLFVKLHLARGSAPVVPYSAPVHSTMAGPSYEICLTSACRARKVLPTRPRRVAPSSEKRSRSSSCEVEACESAVVPKPSVRGRSASARDAGSARPAQQARLAAVVGRGQRGRPRRYQGSGSPWSRTNFRRQDGSTGQVALLVWCSQRCSGSRADRN